MRRRVWISARQNVSKKRVVMNFRSGSVDMANPTGRGGFKKGEHMSTTDDDDEAKATNVVQFIRFKVPDELLAFHDAFYKRGDELRAGFGQWDCCDPVAHALLDLVQAQNNVAQAISDDVDYGAPNVIKPAMDAPAEAAVKLIRAVIATTGWPERPEAEDAYL
jgi:hypothetical protein